MPRNGDSSGRPTSGERIAKVMARAGLCSRREAEAWIAAGRVAVNGKPIASPALDVLPHDRITVDGAPLRPRERTRLFLYHKPRGLLTSHADARGRPTVFAALPEGLPPSVRSGGIGIGYALANAVFGGSAQFMVQWLTGVLHSPLAPGIYMSGALMVGITARLLLPLTIET